MKNDRMKRILALLGVVILLAAAMMPMFFAFGSGENAEGKFRASLGVAIMVPVVAYVIYLVWKVLNRNRPEPVSSIRNVVFDCGNVLVKFDWETYLDSFGFPREEREKLAKAIFLSQTWRERDRWEKTQEEYVRQMVADAPEYEADVYRVMERVEEVIQPLEYSDTWVSFLQDRGFRVYILSNYSEDVLEKTRDCMPYLSHVDGAIFSCHVHQVKPNRDIYETLLTRYNLKPEETVFLDDLEENCRAAEALGIHAIRFESFSQAAPELQNLLGLTGSV